MSGYIGPKHRIALTDSFTKAQAEASFAPITRSRKNLLINGGFDVWQRGVSFSAPGYNTDRWLLEASASDAVTINKSGTKGRMSISQPSPTVGWTVLMQKIENPYYLKGETVALSFSLYTYSGTVISTESDVSIVWADENGNDAGSRVYANQVLVEGKNVYTFDVPDEPLGLHLRVEIRPFKATPSAFDFEFETIQLEIGDTATDFEYRSYGEELALCWRYYQIFPFPQRSVVTASSATGFYVLTPPSKMRVGPAVTHDAVFVNTYTPTGKQLCLWGFGAVSRHDVTGINFTSISEATYIRADFSAALTQGQGYEIACALADTGPLMFLDAEL